jgi:ABC-2 type transport system ATP-binding protein
MQAKFGVLAIERESFLVKLNYTQKLAMTMALAIEVKQLVKVYQKKIRALDGIDVSLEGGAVFAMLGPNGAGKTTLMRILTTQIKPTGGEARVFGLDVSKDGPKIRRLISYVPQEMSIWTDISGYENLLIYSKIYGIPSSERQGIIHNALEKMGMTDVKDQVVKTYSGGMIRRTEIAAALLIKPQIIFLDEPTIGLDPSARTVVWKELMEFKKEFNTTIFFNTHYMDEADMYADHIMLINKGKVLAKGTTDELKHSIGGEIISIETKDTATNESVAEMIRQFEDVKEVTMENSELRVLVEDAETAMPIVLDHLRENNIFISKLGIIKPTLDDVFLKYVGTRIDAGGRSSETNQMRRMIKKG